MQLNKTFIVSPSGIAPQRELRGKTVCFSGLFRGSHPLCGLCLVFPAFYLVMFYFSWYHYTCKTIAKSTPFRDLYRFAETTHTPQGDGNFSVKLEMLTTYTRKGDGNSAQSLHGAIIGRKQLTPARGRKLPLRERAVVLAVETIYTPQGDENHYSISFPSNISWKQLSPPQGGRNNFADAYINTF